MVVCSFGDASANHSTAAGAINTALNTAYRGLPVPILFVCEDNGWGISVPTPPGWIEAAYGSRPGLDYVAADGADPAAAAASSPSAVRTVREQRRPVFLHLKTVRFLGHAGSDAEIAYRRARDIEADYDRDPLLATARVLVAAGVRAGGGAGPLRADPGRDRRRGRAAGRRPTARLGGRGDGPPRPAAPGRRSPKRRGTPPEPPAEASRGPWPSRSTPRWTRSWPPTAG